MPSRFDNLTKRLVERNPNDQFPIHRGARANIDAVRNALVQAEQGYPGTRLFYVDIMRELLEADPHTFSTASKLFAGIANKPVEIMPAKVRGGTEADEENAQVIADACSDCLDRIPQWKRHKRNILWGTFYGTAARELIWARDNDGWWIDKLEFIHTRRLAYDRFFQLLVTDPFGNFTNIYLRSPENYAKFFVFEARLSDEYPTREGLARIVAYWMAFKRFAAREFVGYVESRGKPLVDVSYKVGDRAANEEEVDDAKSLAKQWAAGSTGGVAHPDTIISQLIGPGAGSASSADTPHPALIRLCNEEQSKAILGNTLTTQEGERGARSLGETQKKGEEDLQAAVAGDLDDDIQSDIFAPFVLLNFGPEAARKYLPTHHTKVEPPEDDELAVKAVTQLADRGQPIPTVWVSNRFGIPEAEPGEMVLSRDGGTKLMRSPEEMAADAEAMREQMQQSSDMQDGEGDNQEEDSNAPDGKAPPAKEEKP